MLKYAVLGMILTIAGCAAFSSPRSSLSTLQDAAIAARMTIRPVIDGICAAEKRRCQREQELEVVYLTSDGFCPKYDICSSIRMIIINTLEAVQFAIADANLALAMGQEERFEDAMQRAYELLADVQKQMEMLGIIPEEKSDEPEGENPDSV